MTAMGVADEPSTLRAHQEASARPAELKASLGLRVEELVYPLLAGNPMGGQTSLRYICPSCIVYLGEYRLTCNFIVLNMTHFDVIFGIDWLVSHSAHIDCGDGRITLLGENEDFIHFVDDHGDEELVSHFGL